MMTVSQDAAVKRIKALANKDGYELKSFETEDFEYFISVTGEIGLPGDENNALLKAVYRKPFHLTVGKRGDISYFVWIGSTPVMKEFKGYSILQAIYD